RPADGRPGQRGRPGRARTVPRPGWPAAGIAGMARHREQALAVKQVVIAAIVSHFGHPPGAWPGGLLGWVMEHRPSDRPGTSWVVSLPDVPPSDRVLEIGFGPGLAIAELAHRAGGSGHVYGIDHSEVRLRQAARRNAIASQPRRPLATAAASAARTIEALL